MPVGRGAAAIALLFLINVVGAGNEFISLGNLFRVKRAAAAAGK